MGNMRIAATVGTILALALSSCGSQRNNSESVNVITVTIPPLKGLVEQIVGDDFEINTLLPEGTIPENFSPTPKQITELNNSTLFFYVGTLQFEMDIVQRLNTEGICTSRGIKLIGGKCQHGEANFDEINAAHTADPHVWLSPFELEVIVDNISNALSYRYPDSVEYVANALRIKQELQERQARYAQQLNGAPTAFLIYHPSLGYLAHHYGLEQVSIEHEGKSPSVTTIASIANRIEVGELPAIMFYQQEFLSEVVKPIADILNVSLLVFNPLSDYVIAELDRIIETISGGYEQQ